MSDGGKLPFLRSDGTKTSGTVRKAPEGGYKVILDTSDTTSNTKK